MEKINLKEEQANEFIKEALIDLDYSCFRDTINIVRFKRVEHIEYGIYDKMPYNGGLVSRLKVLDENSYKTLLTHGLNIKGYDITSIKTINREGVISYKIEFNLTETKDSERRLAYGVHLHR